MENQHQHIKGYRDLSEAEIALMNRIKEKAEELGAMVREMDSLPNPGGRIPSQDNPLGTTPPVTVDKRWLNVAKTQLQTGFMALTRSVAQPSTF